MTRIASNQAVLLALFEQRLAADAEHFGGAADFVVRLLERGLDGFALEILERLASQPRRARSPVACRICGKSAGRSSASFAKTSACSMAFFSSRTFPGQA